MTAEAMNVLEAELKHEMADVRHDIAALDMKIEVKTQSLDRAVASGFGAVLEHLRHTDRKLDGVLEELGDVTEDLGDVTEQLDDVTERLDDVADLAGHTSRKLDDVIVRLDHR